MKQLTLHFSSAQIFEAVKISAVNLEMEVKETKFNASLTLSSGGSFFSYGNVITVNIENVGILESLITVSSESASSLQLIDWGTNESLEKDIINEVERILG